MESTLILSSVTPQKIQMSLFQGGGRGSSRMPKCPYFLCLYYGGREGIQVNKVKVFKNALFMASQNVTFRKPELTYPTDDAGFYGIGD